MTSTVSRKRSAEEAIDYSALAQLRYYIRRFLRVREEAARAAGIEPQQYQLLLQVKGLAGLQPPTISALAERMQLRHHSTVELIDRLVRRDMLARRPGGRDRREVLVEIRPAGAAILKRLAINSLHELQRDGPALVAALQQLLRSSRRATRGRAAAPSAGPGRAAAPKPALTAPVIRRRDAKSGRMASRAAKDRARRTPTARRASTPG